jgi:phage-related protein
MSPTSSTPSIIVQIVNGAKTAWSDIQAFIDGEAAKVQAALPSSAVPAFNTTVSDLKQGASDALGLVNGGLTGAEPALVAGVETALDNALGVATGGASLPLNPLVNAGITNLAGLATSAVSAWLLKQQAALAPPVAAAPVQPVPAAQAAG